MIAHRGAASEAIRRLVKLAAEHDPYEPVGGDAADCAIVMELDDISILLAPHEWRDLLYWAERVDWSAR